MVSSTDTEVASRLKLRTPVPMSRVLFGLVFALMATVMPVTLGSVTSPSFGFAMPLAFGALGLGVALGRRGVIVDRAAGTLTTWWGLWFPIGRTSTPLGDVSHVSIGKEVRGSGKHRMTVYPVRLEPGAEALAPQQYQAARSAAEQLANYLGTGLHDVSSGTLQIREAGTLDEPFRDRLRRLGVTTPAPGPVPARFTVREQGDETVCVLPSAGIGAQHLVGLVASLAVGGVLAYFVINARPPRFVVIGAAVIAAVPLLSTLPSLLGAVFGRTTVTFSARGIEVKSWGPFRSRTRVQAAQLEELAVVGASVLARSDRVTLELGANLSEEEATWLQAAITHALCHSMFGA